ncbi:MAG: NifU family protein, partial [Planctomycetaceae bacterium]|nr:NifU family protein [Planctomycetaceae bacterium]
AQKRGVNLNALGIDIHTEEQEEGRVVCKCFTLTEPYLKRKIKELNLHSIAEITGAVKAGGACMTCHHAPGGLQDLLNEVWGEEKKSVNSLALPIVSGHLNNLNNLNNTVSAPLNPRPSTTETAESPKLSPFQFAKKIEKLLDEYLRPMVQKDGGDLELVDIKETTVYIELRGTCAGCAGAGQTLKYLIERTLKEKIDERIRVIQV